ncbi:toll/interleukin-1 receptor domain-containing protein [Peribacillus butanolivorans]|uniref:toll/interleukin-1 receptor domain-containing protein n=1 Tax=Peribacillus butanolivorans TaxID=421767 RepID=UPI00207D46DF|nr:toll/interleukin-1 receptor domain-containing protein [Peribacillus butanolivorans]MCO0597260.1 toll/interleukin-1 receptor domain-containing protein [Peribacillus butanolivorans]
MHVQKLFISHDSKDIEIVTELVDFLENIGVNNRAIFCSSLDGYGIPLGENFLDRIKSELSDDVIVLFVLTKNFYKNPVCMCEMGATWVQTKHHIPIVVPPYAFEDIRGVFQISQAIKINEVGNLNSLLDVLSDKLGVPSLPFSTWERKREKFIKNVNNYISSKSNEPTLGNNTGEKSLNNKSNAAAILVKDSIEKFSNTTPLEEESFLINRRKKLNTMKSSSNNSVISPDSKNEDIDVDEPFFLLDKIGFADDPAISPDPTNNGLDADEPFLFLFERLGLKESNKEFKELIDLKTVYTDNPEKSCVLTEENNQGKSYYKNPENLLRFMTHHFTFYQWIPLDLLREKLKPMTNTPLDIVELFHVLHELERSNKIKFKKYRPYWFNNGIQIKLNKE